MKDNFRNKLEENSHLFEGNVERCRDLYRALCGNIVTDDRDAYTYSYDMASKIAAELHKDIDHMFFRNNAFKEGVISLDIRETLEDIGWGIDGL